MYHEIVALLGYAIDNWNAFDAWALSKGFDPLEAPSRRLMSAVWAWITEGMDQEQLDKFIDSLQPENQTPAWVARTAAKPTENQNIVTQPLESAPAMTGRVHKFRAPEGWKPAWYDEDQGYAATKNFMSAKNSGFRNNKGGE